MEDIMDVEDDNWRNVKISANTILENKEYKKIMIKKESSLFNNHWYKIYIIQILCLRHIIIVS